MRKIKLPSFEHFAQLFDFSQEEQQAEEKKEQVKYTKKIDGLIYHPQQEKQPHIQSLVNTDKMDELLTKIETADITEEERAFLIVAAMRHNVFNYENIAEYYAHANKEMQELMEDSALVIIDFDKAIENGYVQFSTKMKELWFNSWGEKNEK